MFEKVQRWFRRRTYREGRMLSRMVAKDVRREILIVSAKRIDEGIIVGRVRTTNVLYVSNGLVAESEFEPEQESQIDKLWVWTGKPWGGLATRASCPI